MEEFFFLEKSVMMSTSLLTNKKNLGFDNVALKSTTLAKALLLSLQVFLSAKGQSKSV